MRARSALFDLYGDHLSAHGYWAPIAGIVRTLGAVSVAPPAVRTAVSRVVREGWLTPRETDGVRGYAATGRAEVRLKEAHRRIYRRQEQPWDGRWHLVVVTHPSDRSRRARLEALLQFLGYGRLAPATWVAARPGPDVAASLAAEDTSYDEFSATFTGSGPELAARLWDLGELGASYARFLIELRVRTGTEDALELADQLDPQEAFAVRTELVHEWRKFLFRDPGLPAEVLPADWPGVEAAAAFRAAADALMPGAQEFVTHCMMSESRSLARPDDVADERATD